MLPIEIRRVQTRRERKEFVLSSWRYNAGDPCWVPPLVADTMAFIDPARGPFFEHGEAEFFAAFRGTEPVGRISAHLNAIYDGHHGPGTGFVGFFECEDDAATAASLFNAAENWLRGRGRKSALGPLSFSVYDEAGVLVEGFRTPPFVMTPHNPPYYARLFEENGWRKAADWYAFRGMHGVSEEGVNPRFGRYAERVLKRPGLAIRNIDPKGDIQREVKIVQSIFNPAWDENWGHVDLTDREFERIKDAVVRMVIPELSPLVEIDGRPAAFALSLCDANVAVKRIGGRLFPLGWITMLATMRRTDRFRLIAMGVLPEYRRQGLEAAMYYQVFRESIRLGYREIEMSQIVETNERMLSSLAHWPIERSKTWRIYGKDL